MSAKTRSYSEDISNHGRKGGSTVQRKTNAIQTNKTSPEILNSAYSSTKNNCFELYSQLWLIQKENKTIET